MSSRVLVTGGAGFIGSHLVRGLAGRGEQVRVLDDLSTGSEDNLAGVSGDLEFVKGDVRDPGTCRRAAQGCRAVFHLAAMPSVQGSIEDPALAHDINVGGTLNILEACRQGGAEKFILASSTAVYGDAAGVPAIESSPARPLSPYALHKLVGEQYATLYSRLFGLETVSLRYFNIFGPSQDPTGAYAAAIPLFMEAAAAGLPVTVYGDGEQTRDFTYVDNVVSANLRALDAEDLGGRVLNIGTGRGLSVNELLRLMEKVTGKALNRRLAPERRGEVRHSAADIKLAADVLGYDIGTELEQGLQLTWDWFTNNTDK
jgi:nucleoside-diphosphate-sugar epimerase